MTEGFYNLSAYNRILVLESLMNVALCTQLLGGHIDDMADKMIELVKVTCNGGGDDGDGGDVDDVDDDDDDVCGGGDDDSDNICRKPM